MAVAVEGGPVTVAVPERPPAGNVRVVRAHLVALAAAADVSALPVVLQRAVHNEARVRQVRAPCAHREVLADKDLVHPDRAGMLRVDADARQRRRHERLLPDHLLVVHK